MFWQPFLAVECDMIIADFNKGISAEVTAGRLCLLSLNVERNIRRSRSAVLRQRLKLGLKKSIQWSGEPVETDSHIKCDEKFQARMLRAIKSGKEHAKRGTFKDDTPIVAKMIHPAPYTSGCSSSAQLCAEYGDRRARGFEPTAFGNQRPDIKAMKAEIEAKRKAHKPTRLLEEDLHALCVESI